MKNIFIFGLFICLLSQVSFAVDAGTGLNQDANNAGSTSSIFNRVQIGLDVDAKIPTFTGSTGNFTASNNPNAIYGVGLAIKIPLSGALSVVAEGQYNTVSSYTNSLGGKTDISVYPLQVSLQGNVGGLYVGGGINYTLWKVSVSGSDLTQTNGIGYQAYAGLGVFAGSVNLEIKYTHMNASTSVAGVLINEAADTISAGVRLWI